MRKAYRFAGLLVTTTFQAQGAPIVDSCTSRDADGIRYKGKCIHLTPWRRNEYGDREMGLALVIARRMPTASKGVVQRVAEFIEEFSPAACASQQPNRTSPTGLTNADLDPANHQ